MELVVVTVPDCPNAPTLERRLTLALAAIGAAAAATIERRTVADDEQAARWQMRGSPTLLIDGRDPFADLKASTGLACRIYRDEQGLLEAAPSVAALVTVLRRALEHRPSGGGQARCDRSPEWSDALGRAGAGLLAPAAGGLRAVHQRVLRSFAEAGRAPSEAQLAQAVHPYGVSAGQVLAELHAADFLRLDAAGHIRATYPFSASPTPHRVRIAGGPTVFAMCAIDALGIAAMLGREVRIASADPLDNRPITVDVIADGNAGRWAPMSAVVYAGQQVACDSCPPAASEVCCDYLNFFADSVSARAWAESHPQVSGQILSQQAALELGAGIFGRLLGLPDSVRRRLRTSP